MNDRFKFRIAVYERQQNNMPWAFVEYIDPDNQHWGLNQCGDIISDSSYSAHYTRKNAPDSVHRVYEPEQCTGLKDKNGNLIYENDRVGFYVYGQNEEWHAQQGTVIWYNSCWGIETSSRFIQFENELTIKNPKDIEIIGNVHKQAEQKE